MRQLQGGGTLYQHSRHIRPWPREYLVHRQGPIPEEETVEFTLGFPVLSPFGPPFVNLV